MKEVRTNLFIGTEADCNFTNDDIAIIHACKHPCHINAVGYKGSLPSTHPYYLIFEKEKHLFLNIVDMEREFSPVYTHPIMKSSMAFIEKHISDRKVLIHCNQGLSRSPSIALLYLARKENIGNSTYVLAVNDFRKLYPMFDPGTGIALYMNKYWNELMFI